MFALKQVTKIFVLTLAEKMLGMCAIRADREWVIEEDFFKATRKVKEQKKLETKMEYTKL
jgi:ATP-dependent 26S proteasome regulatory subunit